MDHESLQSLKLLSLKANVVGPYTLIEKSLRYILCFTGERQANFPAQTSGPRHVCQELN